MKIVTLNIWSGIVGEKLLQFFKDNQDIDIFCLQEVMHQATEWTRWNGQGNEKVLQEIRNVLPSHIDYFRPAEQKGEWGLATFYKENYSGT